MKQPPKPKRKFRSFKRVVDERHKDFEIGHRVKEMINEMSEDMVIASASSVLIDDDTTPEAREQAINVFAKDINKMTANRIIAIAIACNY